MVEEIMSEENKDKPRSTAPTTYHCSSWRKSVAPSHSAVDGLLRFADAPRPR